MPCERIKDGFMCSSNTVEYNGWLMEFPAIGTPVMLKWGTFEVVDYCDTPSAFWDAAKEYQAKQNLKIESSSKD